MSFNLKNVKYIYLYHFSENERLFQFNFALICAGFLLFNFFFYLFSTQKIMKGPQLNLERLHMERVRNLNKGNDKTLIEQSTLYQTNLLKRDDFQV